MTNSSRQAKGENKLERDEIWLIGWITSDVCMLQYVLTATQAQARED